MKGKISLKTLLVTIVFFIAGLLFLSGCPGVTEKPGPEKSPAGSPQKPSERGVMEGKYVITVTLSPYKEGDDADKLLKEAAEVVKKRLDPANEGVVKVKTVPPDKVAVTRKVAGSMEELEEIVKRPGKVVFEFGQGDDKKTIENPGIKSADAYRNERAGSRVEILLDDETGKKVEKLTTEYKGKMVSVIMDGETLTRAQIMEPITDNKVMITFVKGPMEKSEKIAQVLNSGPLPMKVTGISGKKTAK